MMTTYEKAVKKYNQLMNGLCREYLTIGTSFSEDTENWNSRDMVSEAQYTLDMLRDPDCMEYQDAHSRIWEGWSTDWDKDAYQEWYNNCKKLERFINRYKDEALTMDCTIDHCSKYD